MAVNNAGERPRDLAAAVILATRNGEAVIAGALESLMQQTLAPEQFEVIVVDNGSTDATRARVLELADRSPGRIRLIEEPAAGLSRSRNAGLRASRARAAAFFDDDARACPGWLAALIAPFSDPRVGAVGGPIELTWTAARPAWWTPELDLVQGRVNYGGESRRLEYPQMPYGSNLAVRRSVLETVGLFRESLGRKAAGLMAGEEVELELRILKAGFEIVYTPPAEIIHLAVPRRATMSYVRRQAYWHGRSLRLAEEVAGDIRLKRLSALPFFLVKSLAGYVLKHRFSKARERELIFYWGYAREAMARKFQPVRPGPPPGFEASP